MITKKQEQDVAKFLNDQMENMAMYRNDTVIDCWLITGMILEQKKSDLNNDNKAFSAWIKESIPALADDKHKNNKAACQWLSRSWHTVNGLQAFSQSRPDLHAPQHVKAAWLKHAKQAEKLEADKGKSDEQVKEEKLEDTIENMLKRLKSDSDKAIKLIADGHKFTDSQLDTLIKLSRDLDVKATGISVLRRRKNTDGLESQIDNLKVIENLKENNSPESVQARMNELMAA